MNQHCIHKTVLRPPQVCDGNPYSNKTASSWRIEAQLPQHGIACRTKMTGQIKLWFLHRRPTWPLTQNIWEYLTSLMLETELLISHQQEINNWISEYSVGCNFLSINEIPAAGAKVSMCKNILYQIQKYHSLVTWAWWCLIWIAE